MVGVPIPQQIVDTDSYTVPWIVNGFFKLITPFIDPLTRQKLKFNDDMRQHVPPQQLWNEFHGDLEFEYDHQTYWPALLKLCEAKQAEHRERWVKAGKNYGESELYIKGGYHLSISTQKPHAVAQPERTKETSTTGVQEASIPAPPAYEEEKVVLGKHSQQAASTPPVFQDEKSASVDVSKDGTELKPSV
jgi:hypothetical protein